MPASTLDAAKRRTDLAMRRARVGLDAAACDAFDDLVYSVWSGSRALSRRSCPSPEIVAAIAAMARWHADFVRAPHTFVATSSSPIGAVRDLAEHLFALYPVPVAMSAAWLTGSDEPSREHEWYVRLGRGDSVRDLAIPILVTRALAHALRSAPFFPTVAGALVWAQARTMGASDELARAFAESRIGRTLAHDDTRRSLVEILVRDGAAPEHVGPVVDYLAREKLEARDGFRADGTFGPTPPPEPDLSLDGRTLGSLLRRVDAWHVAAGRAPVSDVAWPSSGISGLSFEERLEPRLPDEQPTLRIVSIVELLSSFELVREGRAMRHCVASYAGECIQGKASIWSLRATTRQGQKRLLTIEIDLRARTVRQARRLANRLAGPRDKEILAVWAQRERLTLPPNAIL
jgi:hypothetical protein